MDGSRHEFAPRARPDFVVCERSSPQPAGPFARGGCPARFPDPIRDPAIAAGAIDRGGGLRGCRGTAGTPDAVDPRTVRVTHRHRDRGRQRTALRGADALLPTVPRSAFQVLELLLSHLPGKPGRGRGHHARPHLRARGLSRWADHSGVGLRLGIALAVDGLALSERSDHRGVQFPHAAGIHRRGGPPERARQPEDHHL